jgi:hypothetical protein
MHRVLQPCIIYAHSPKCEHAISRTSRVSRPRRWLCHARLPKSLTTILLPKKQLVISTSSSRFTRLTCVAALRFHRAERSWLRPAEVRPRGLERSIRTGELAPGFWTNRADHRCQSRWLARVGTTSVAVAVVFGSLLDNHSHDLEPSVTVTQNSYPLD